MLCRFLPIAERELRAAARRRATYHFRWWAALLTIVASVLWLSAHSVAGLPGARSSPLFALQTAGAFVLTLLAGAFFTSDCLSEEKRDGTLALLFLTDLKAGDIVLGKFAATSLSAFNGLLALLPVTGIPLLLGGVALGEFWRMVLTLLNTLFFSLALGLCVSAFTTDYSRALAGTLGLLLLMGAALPAAAELILSPSRYAGWSLLAWVSPYYPFACAWDAPYAANPRQFWVTLAGSHCAAWLCLALASSGLGRVWRNRDTEFRPVVSGRKLEIASREPRWHPSADDVFDPVVRLAGDMKLLRFIVWVIALAGGIWVCAGRFWVGPSFPAQFVARGCAFLLKALFAFQACRFFVETRRNGALELLVCTPFRTADLISAQWRLLRRVFLWPMAIFLGLCWADVVFGAAPGTLSGPTSSRLSLETGITGVMFLSAGLAADVLAAGWFGMWLALKSSRPGLAPGLTILAVLILPVLLYRFDLVADMLFISWGTTRFQEDFRSQIANPLPSVERSVRR